MLWNIVAQHLRGIGELCWAHGRIADSKKTQDMTEHLKESLKMIVSLSHAYNCSRS